MMIVLDLIQTTLKTNFKKLIFVVFLTVFLEGFVANGVVFGYVNYIKKQMDNNIKEYNEVDIQQLCNISDCSEILKDDGRIFLNNGKTIIKGKFHEHYFIYSLNEVYVDTHFNLFIYNNLAQAKFKIRFKEIKCILLNSFYIFTPFLFLIFFIMLFFSLKDEKDSSLKTIAGTEAILSNKSMILITENIHHELNSPLEVIDSKIIKLKKLFNEYNEQNFGKRESDETFKLISKDFDLILQSSEQIFNVLEKMKGFKSLRYSNGNKTFYDIIEGAFKVISISNSNFNFKIADKLKEFSIDSQKFNNSDLLNIVINHIKNSLDANANMVYIVFNSFNKGIICFDIIDNGNGIPEDIRKHIFKANFSTKTVGDSGVRGNGLYLNKFILSYVNGTITLIESNKYGTSFRICLKAKERDENYIEESKG